MRLRIHVIGPPAGVTLRLQRGRDQLVEPSAVTPATTTFDFEVRVSSRSGGLPNFLGEFTQGPPASRFVYVNSGQMAGQAGTHWSRRAKIPLTGISQKLIDRVTRSGGVLAVDVAGTGRDGGPACATVKLVDDAWRVEPE